MNLSISRARWPRSWSGDGFGQLFGNDWASQAWPSAWLGQEPAAFPALTAWSDDEAMHVEAEIPGLPLDALELTVMGDEFTIAGERQEVIEEGVTHHRRERGVGQFSRVLRLPFDVEAEQVEARLQDGVLAVRLPRAEAARPRKIEVKTGR